MLKTKQNSTSLKLRALACKIHAKYILPNCASAALPLHQPLWNRVPVSVIHRECMVPTFPWLCNLSISTPSNRLILLPSFTSILYLHTVLPFLPTLGIIQPDRLQLCSLLLLCSFALPLTTLFFTIPTRISPSFRCKNRH